jgi:hypothetical protein
MCDTVAIRRGDGILFAKNSDREPDEAQRVERHAAVGNDTAATLRCTHIDIAQIPQRRATILCRPDWMWGAEMGVNDAGVAIGNEAVFSRRTLRRGKALLGMDLVRLGLERGASAQHAAEVIVDLLERYGQGGPAGHRDKNFRYDNSFLIADPTEILELETCGRDWLLRRADGRAAISNAYSIEGDAGKASAGAPAQGFGASLEHGFMRRLAHAHDRRNCALDGLDRMTTPDLPALADLMRRHDRGDGFSRGSTRDLCMHHGGPFRPHHTTNTMLALLRPGERPRIAVTGTRTPCISIFRPAGFEGGWSVFDPALWERGARLHDRLTADPAQRERVRNRIAAAEARILPLIEDGDPELAEALIRAWDDHSLDAPDAAVSGRTEIDAPSR